MEMERTILCLTLALWSAGFIVLGRLRRRGERSSPDASAAVSIIIPARNEEHNLPTLLRSFSSQSVKPCEIIVVDDGSTDRTAG
jgi:4,4'-diaponeurosporenoate glycosyltransferase